MRTSATGVDAPSSVNEVPPQDRVPLLRGGNRRQVFGIAAAVVAGTFGSLTDLAAVNRNKRRQRNLHKKKRRARKKKNGPVMQEPAPVPPPPPVQTPAGQSAYECSGSPDNLARHSGDDRIAQVFVASRSGKLSKIEVSVHNYPGSTEDYLLQLVSVVEEKGVPSHSPLDVIAAVQIPGSTVPEGDAVLIGTFAGTGLVEGRQYAAVVSRPGSNSFATLIHEGNTCQGELFRASGREPFDLIDKPITLILSVSVV